MNLTQQTTQQTTEPAGSAGEDLVDGHPPANDMGWTRCPDPQAQMGRHPDNCSQGSRLRNSSSSKMTYAEFAARRDEREQLAHARALNDALAVLARHFDLTVEDVTRRLAAEE